MVGTHIYQNITRLAESLGFAACGVAAACRLEEESEHYLSAMKEGCFAEMEYLKRNCEKREDPRLLFEGAKSILAFLAPYGDESATPEKEVIFGNGICGRYKIAQYALGEDYHRIIKELVKSACRHNFTVLKDIVYGSKERRRWNRGISRILQLLPLQPD